MDLRLHSRPDSGRPSAQVADVGGRIYSRVLGAARVRIADWARRTEDLSQSDWATRRTDANTERQRLRVHLRGAGGLVTGNRGKDNPSSRGEPLGERLYRIVSQSATRRVSGASGIRGCKRRSGKGGVVPAGIQCGTTTQLVGLRDAEGVQRSLRSRERPLRTRSSEGSFISKFLWRNSHKKWTKKRGAAHQQFGFVLCEHVLRIPSSSFPSRTSVKGCFVFCFFSSRPLSTLC